MSPRFSDLPSGQEDPRKAEERAREVIQLQEDIEIMLDTGRYEWARDTLEGIYETLSKSGRATQGQHRAVENIQRKGDR